ncbi:MAG: hypothetical protein AAFR59_13655 [Bacteroidota bacterium]
MKQLFPIFSILLLFLFSCKATKRAYELGDYDRAVLNSIERLRNSPDNKKSRETLTLAYPAFIDYVEDRIISFKLGTDVYKWERIMEQYALLNRVYDEIQRSPGAKQIIPNPNQYLGEYREAVSNAAAARYALGTDAIQQGRVGDRVKAKDAYYQFGRALEILPNYRDAESLQLEARDLATVYVEVEAIPPPAAAMDFRIAIEPFESQLMGWLAQSNLSPFVYFYSARATEKPLAGPTHIVRMVFEDFTIGQTRYFNTTEARKRDSVVVGTVDITPDSTVDVYGTVEAEVRRFDKEVFSGGTLDMRIINAYSGELLVQRDLAGSYVWKDFKGFFNGDKRALEPDDLRYVEKLEYSPPPPPEILFQEFSRPIVDQFQSFCRQYYQGM